MTKSVDVDVDSVQMDSGLTWSWLNDFRMMKLGLFLTVIFSFCQVSWGACPGVAMEMSCQCCLYNLLPPPPLPPPPPPLTGLTFTVAPSAEPDVTVKHQQLLMFFITPSSLIFLLIISIVCYKLLKRNI